MKYRAQGVELGVWAFWSAEVGVLRRAFRVSSLELRVDHVFGGTPWVSSRESISARKNGETSCKGMALSCALSPLILMVRKVGFM